MKRVLLTGAAGNIGSYLRKLLPPIYPGLVLSDIATPPDLLASETFIKADISKPDEICTMQALFGACRVGEAQHAHAPPLRFEMRHPSRPDLPDSQESKPLTFPGNSSPCTS